jgi:hypothetical protein
MGMSSNDIDEGDEEELKRKIESVLKDHYKDRKVTSIGIQKIVRDSRSKSSHTRERDPGSKLLHYQYSKKYWKRGLILRIVWAAVALLMWILFTIPALWIANQYLQVQDVYLMIPAFLLILPAAYIGYKAMAKVLLYLEKREKERSHRKPFDPQ